MNNSLLPLVLLCLAVGLTLSFAPRRAGWVGAGALVLVAAIGSASPFPVTWKDPAFLSLWICAITIAALAFLPGGVPSSIAIVAGGIAGLCAGMITAIGSAHHDLAIALPCVLLFVPGAWLASRRYGIAVKVAASWIIAISMLAGLVSLTPTPGYKQDHME